MIKCDRCLKQKRLTRHGEALSPARWRGIVESDATILGGSPLSVNRRFATCAHTLGVCLA